MGFFVKNLYWPFIQNIQKYLCEIQFAPPVFELYVSVIWSTKSTPFLWLPRLKTSQSQKSISSCDMIHVLGEFSSNEQTKEMVSMEIWILEAIFQVIETF